MSATLPEEDYVLISPYLLAPGTAKKVNVGDGFIMDSAVKLLGARPRRVLSSRVPLSAADIESINAGRFVMAAGANTLKDDFEITPGFTPATLAAIKVPVLLCGIGHYGVDSVTSHGLSADSVDIMTEILRRFPFISVRCDASHRYVARSLPGAAEQILMTSCPVVFPVDGRDCGFLRKARYDQLVVTLTDRAALPQQVWMLDAAPKLFPAARRILALHQDYGNRQLWDFAAGMGYEVFRSNDYHDFLELYAVADMHFGNRVHAHLKCLSHGVVSFLTPFDLRQKFFAESLDFPLIDRLPHAAIADYDFTRTVVRRAAARQAMDRFTAAARALLG